MYDEFVEKTEADERVRPKVVERIVEQMVGAGWSWRRPLCVRKAESKTCSKSR